VSRNFPVIELEAVREPEASIGVRREIAHQVASACEEIGFFAVTGHGVPGAVIADLVAESYAFFDLPLAAKLKASLSIRCLTTLSSLMASSLLVQVSAGRPAACPQIRDEPHWRRHYMRLLSLATTRHSPNIPCLAVT